MPSDLPTLTLTDADGKDWVYESRYMDPLLVLEDAGRLGSIIGPAIQRAGSLIAAGDDSAMKGLTASESSISKEVIGAFVEMAGTAAQQLRNPDVMVVIGHLFDCCSVNGLELGRREGKMVQWRLHFQGKTGDMLKVIKWLMGVQFADFLFDVRQRLLAALASKEKSTGFRVVEAEA